MAVVNQQLSVVALTYDGGYVPWTGTPSSVALTTAFNIRLTMQLSEVGAWSFDALTEPDPSVDPLDGVAAAGAVDPLLPIGTLVVFKLTESAADQSAAGDASASLWIAAGIVEAYTVDWTGDESPVVRYSGRTCGAALEHAIVYPYNGVDARPLTQVRDFTWAAPEYDDSGWSTAKTITTQGTSSAAWTLDSGAAAPESWPFQPDAEWIWSDNPGGGTHDPSSSSTSTTSSAALGTCLFRKAWTPSAAGRYAIFVTADNYFVAYLDGIEIASNRDNAYGWQTCTRFDVLMDTNAHTLAVRAQNVGGLGSNPAGVLVTVKQVQPDNTLVDELISDDTWLCAPYVLTGEFDTYPGVQPTVMMSTLLDEALARDTGSQSVLNAFTFDWTDTTGADGGTIDIAQGQQAQIGDTLLDVLRGMVATSPYWWADVPIPPLAGSSSPHDAVRVGIYANPFDLGTPATFALGTTVQGFTWEAEG